LMQMAGLGFLPHCWSLFLILDFHDEISCCVEKSSSLPVFKRSSNPVNNYRPLATLNLFLRYFNLSAVDAFHITLRRSWVLLIHNQSSCLSQHRSSHYVFPRATANCAFCTDCTARLLVVVCVLDTFTGFTDSSFYALSFPELFHSPSVRCLALIKVPLWDLHCIVRHTLQN
jgi:hypothetical protein